MSTMKSAKAKGEGIDYPAPLRLLFVENDVQRVHLIDRALRQCSPDTELRHVPTLAEAKSIVLHESCELALVNHQMPDGNSFDFLDYVQNQALDLPVVVLGCNGSNGTAEAALRAGASDFIYDTFDREALDKLPERLKMALARHRESRYLHEDEEDRVDSTLRFEGLRAAMVSLKHEINNPLAIISGNAQLLLELAKVMNLDQDLIRSIRDIEEASQRVSASIDKLVDLNKLLALSSQPVSSSAIPTIGPAVTRLRRSVEAGTSRNL